MTFAMLTQPETWLSLLTLTAMEIVLGIDNIVFLAIITGRLPPTQRPLARRLGLSLALGARIGLLLAISWIMGLTEPLFTVLGRAFSGRDVILFGGGFFLLAKATREIHERLEVAREERAPLRAGAFGLVLAQILALDIVFSLDSVITAVGMAQHVPVMVTAMVTAVAIMLVFAGRIGDFVNRHPTLQILALSFLLLIGIVLVADGMGQHISKGYIYFAMAFSLGVEILNLRMRRRIEPVALHRRFAKETETQG